MAIDRGDFRRARRRRGTANTTKERACITKRTYGRRAARKAARILRRENADHVHAYPCPWCGRWHVGHTSAEDVAW